MVAGMLFLFGRLLHHRSLGGARCTNATETCPTGNPTKLSRVTEHQGEQNRRDRPRIPRSVPIPRPLPDAVHAGRLDVPIAHEKTVHDACSAMNWPRVASRRCGCSCCTQCPASSMKYGPVKKSQARVMASSAPGL